MFNQHIWIKLEIQLSNFTSSHINGFILVQNYKCLLSCVCVQDL